MVSVLDDAGYFKFLIAFGRESGFSCRKNIDRASFRRPIEVQTIINVTKSHTSALRQLCGKRIDDLLAVVRETSRAVKHLVRIIRNIREHNDIEWSGRHPRQLFDFSSDKITLLCPKKISMSDTVAVMTGAMPPDKIPAGCLA